jgi:anhydro-N-acetylmuramic acid kinase
MVYRVIGTMSGSSMDGLDIAYCTFVEVAGVWQFELVHASCIPFDETWKEILPRVNQLSGFELLLAHTAFGKWMGESISEFILKHQLAHKVHLIASHGHTVFHDPAQQMTFQMGDGSAIAAITGLPVVSDLRNMDIALGGQGAPIIPVGEKLLWPEFSAFLNLGGISNISIKHESDMYAFDICPANRVLNELSAAINLEFDPGGTNAAKGHFHEALFNELNAQPYYQKLPPKSLANEFGSKTLVSIFDRYPISTEDKLHTFCRHIAFQIKQVVSRYPNLKGTEIMVTGGGAQNHFLMECIQTELIRESITLHLPDAHIIDNKEAIVMGLIGVLRWREEANVFASVTGAKRNSVGGALWMGHD